MAKLPRRDMLRALERDLHQHIHEENNILFPRVRGLLAA
jgi:iron-sulfur cluster repair protein YtfE (RIC family)